jgi:hypothetical protein
LVILWRKHHALWSQQSPLHIIWSWPRNALHCINNAPFELNLTEDLGLKNCELVLFHFAMKCFPFGDIVSKQLYDPGPGVLPLVKLASNINTISRCAWAHCVFYWFSQNRWINVISAWSWYRFFSIFIESIIWLLSIFTLLYALHGSPKV